MAADQDPGTLQGRIAQLRALVGSSVIGVPETVERNDIGDYAEAIRWPDAALPRYVDEAAARRTWAGGIVAPPTFLSRLARIRGFSLPMPVPAWWPALPGILAAAEIEQPVPIRPGDRLVPVATIRDVALHVTPDGTLAGIVRDFEFTNQRGERVGRTRRTIAKYLDAPLFDRTGLDDPIGSQPARRARRPGDREILPFSRAVTLMELNRFAGANREWGRYHMDPEFARTLGLAGALVIEHLKLAYLANMLEDWLGDAGRIDRLSASFLALDTVPVTLTARGLADRPSDGAAVTAGIWIEDDAGRTGTIGEARLVMG